MLTSSLPPQTSRLALATLLACLLVATREVGANLGGLRFGPPTSLPTGFRPSPHRFGHVSGSPAGSPYGHVSFRKAGLPPTQLGGGLMTTTTTTTTLPGRGGLRVGANPARLAASQKLAQIQERNPLGLNSQLSPGPLGPAPFPAKSFNPATQQQVRKAAALRMQQMLARHPVNEAGL